MTPDCGGKGATPWRTEIGPTEGEVAFRINDSDLMPLDVTPAKSPPQRKGDMMALKDRALLRKDLRQQRRNSNLLAGFTWGKDGSGRRAGRAEVVLLQRGNHGGNEARNLPGGAN